MTNPPRDRDILLVSAGAFVLGLILVAIGAVIDGVALATASVIRLRS